MASEATITNELIFKAAGEIASGGKRPTLELVRALLATWTNTKGGSFATLAPTLRAWKQAQRTSAAEPMREAVPAAVSERFVLLASDLWAIANDTASARLSAEREAINKARADTEAETVEALELAERMTEQRDMAFADAASLREQIDQMRAEMVSSAARAEADLRHSHEDAMASQQAAERAAAQLAQQRSEFEGWQIKHAANLELGATAREESERLRSELQAAAERERSQIEQATKAKAEAARLDDQLKDQKARSAEVIGRLEASKHKIEAELSETRRELRELSAALGQVTGERDALRTQVGAQTEVIKAFAPTRGEHKARPNKTEVPAAPSLPAQGLARHEGEPCVARLG